MPEAAPAGTSRWRDAGAGLCVAGLLIPEAVAYAGLAQLPVSHALNATLAGLAIYAIFGRSRFAIVAPTSSSATLSAAAVVSMPGLAGAASAQGFVQASMALVLLAGVVLMLLAWARQGQLSAFVSRPVLRGFAFALAITIVVRQLPDALGCWRDKPCDRRHGDSFRHRAPAGNGCCLTMASNRRRMRGPVVAAGAARPRRPCGLTLSRGVRKVVSQGRSSGSCTTCDGSIQPWDPFKT